MVEATQIAVKNKPLMLWLAEHVLDVKRALHSSNSHRYRTARMAGKKLQDKYKKVFSITFTYKLGTRCKSDYRTLIIE